MASTSFTIWCPNCGNELEVELSLGMPEKDVGISSVYIDDHVFPTCDNESCGFKEFSKELQDKLLNLNQDSAIDGWCESQAGRDHLEH